MSVELLAKACLASVHPSLLATGNAADALIVFAGRARVADLDPLGVPTVSGEEAMARAAKLSAGRVSYTSAKDDTGDRLVFSVRNAAAHLALVDEGSLRRAVSVMIRLTMQLLAAFDLARPADYWGSFVDIAVSMANVEADAARERARAKVAAAIDRFSIITGELGDAAKRAYIGALETTPIGHEGDYDEDATCPACGSRGTLSAVSDHDENGFVGYYFVHFRCPVCRVELVGDELVEYGLDEGQFDYEPDEDDLRGR